MVTFGPIRFYLNGYGDHCPVPQSTNTEPCRCTSPSFRGCTQQLCSLLQNKTKTLHHNSATEIMQPTQFKNFWFIDEKQGCLAWTYTDSCVFSLLLLDQMDFYYVMFLVSLSGIYFPFSVIFDGWCIFWTVPGEFCPQKWILLMTDTSNTSLLLVCGTQHHSICSCTTEIRLWSNAWFTYWRAAAQDLSFSFFSFF